MPPKPKPGSLKKPTKPTYTKKSEVASSTAVVDKLKNTRQGLNDRIVFNTINGLLVKNVKDKNGKVVKRSYTNNNIKVTQTSKKNKLLPYF